MSIIGNFVKNSFEGRKTKIPSETLEIPLSKSQKKQLGLPITVSKTILKNSKKNRKHNYMEVLIFVLVIAGVVFIYNALVVFYAEMVILFVVVVVVVVMLMLR